MIAKADQPTRYGWVIVAALALLLGCTHGIITSGISVFDPAIIADLGVSRGALKLRDLVQLFSAGAWALAIGFTAGRLGSRTIIYAGLALLAIVLVGYGHVTALPQIYGLHFLLAFCYSSCHVVVVLMILTRWFATRRNAALGIILAGESVGGAVFPQVNVWLIGLVGWRAAMEWLALVPVVLAVVLVLVLRESPASLGRRPFGWCLEVPTFAAADVAIANIGAEPRRERRGLSEQLLQPGVVMVVTAAALIFYVGGGVAAHTFLFFRDNGLSPAAAATALSLFFGCAFLGKASSGVLSERWRVLDVWIAFQTLMLVGALAITIDVASFAFAVIACLGLGWGGCYTLSQALIMERFEGPYLARLSGITVLVEGLTAGLGSFVTGLLFDATGRYTMSFALMGGCLFTSLLLSMLLRTVRKK